MTKQIRPPWLVQSDKVYVEKGPWESYGDYEYWLLDQLGESLSEAYQAMDGVLQANLYGVFSDLFKDE